MPKNRFYPRYPEFFVVISVTYLNFNLLFLKSNEFIVDNAPAKVIYKFISTSIR